jgi:hypothetical protein
MEDFTLPSVGTSFKKWESCTPILPNCQAYPHNTKKSQKSSKIAKKEGQPTIYQTASRGCPLAVRGFPKPAPPKFLLLPALIFLHMWLALAG